MQLKIVQDTTSTRCQVVNKYFLQSGAREAKNPTHDRSRCEVDYSDKTTTSLLFTLTLLSIYQIVFQQVSDIEFSQQ